MTHSTLHFRDYKPSDQDDVWELNNLARVPGLDLQDRDEWYADLKNIEAQYIEPGGAFILGQHLESTRIAIAAMGALEPHIRDNSAELRRIRVHPELNGRGFAKQLISRLEEEARMRSFAALTGHTTTKQRAMHRIFDTLEFTETHRAPKGGTTMIYFKKDLILPEGVSSSTPA